MNHKTTNKGEEVNLSVKPKPPQRKNWGIIIKEKKYINTQIEEINEELT